MLCYWGRRKVGYGANLLPTPLMPLKRLSRRRFALTVGTGAATAAAVQAQKKKDPEPDAESPPPVEPCVRNPVLGDFPVPMSAEPAFRFQA